MKRSSSNSSASTARAPYSPVKRLVEVPIAFYEILDLATRGNTEGIVPLIQSVIEVTQANPGGLRVIAATCGTEDAAVADHVFNTNAIATESEEQ